MPMLPVNRPAGSLGRSQACNLALRLWGDTAITDDVLGVVIEAGGPPGLRPVVSVAGKPLEKQSPSQQKGRVSDCQEDLGVHVPGVGSGRPEISGGSSSMEVPEITVNNSASASPRPSPSSPRRAIVYLTPRKHM